MFPKWNVAADLFVNEAVNLSFAEIYFGFSMLSIIYTNPTI